MVVFSGDHLLALAVYSLQAFHCMGGPMESTREGLLTNPAEKSVGVGIATAGAKDVMFKHGSAPPPQTMNDPSMAQKVNNYFTSVRELRQSISGERKDHLENIMSIPKSEKASSSQASPVENSYWTLMQLESRWEDFNKLVQDRCVLREELSKSEHNQWKSTGMLRLISGLELVHNSLGNYIEEWAEDWAPGCNLQRGILLAKNRGRNSNILSSTAVARESVTRIALKQLRKIFPCKEIINVSPEELFFQNSHGVGKDLIYNITKELYLKTIDQLHKYGLLGENEFKDCFMKWYDIRKIYRTKPITSSDKISPFGEDPYNGTVQSIKNQLTSWHPSPYLSIFQVDPESKINILHIFIESNLEPNSMGNSLLRDQMKEWNKSFFKDRQLLKCLKGVEKSCDDFTKKLHQLINLFITSPSWKDDWASLEDLGSMRDILEYIDENFLQADFYGEPPRIITEFREAFEKTGVKKRIELMSSQTAAHMELYHISKYLDNSFPLKEINGIKPPVTPLQELELITYAIEHSEVQKDYMSILDGIGEEQNVFREEITSQCKKLYQKIGKMENNQSSPMKRIFSFLFSPKRT